MVRIILSGQSPHNLVVKSIGSAHQFLNKPCHPKLLRETITRAYALRDRLNDGELKKLLMKISSLPSPPALYQQILQELEKPEPSIQGVGALIEQDIGMSAKILRVVNSAYFGLNRTVSTPTWAIKYIGLEMVQAIVLNTHIFSQFDSSTSPKSPSTHLWDHCFKTSVIARDIAKKGSEDPQLISDSFIAALLHDAGELALIDNMRDRYEEVLALANTDNMSNWEAERRIFGTTHSEIGGYLLGLWGLPDAIVEALLYHHAPRESNTSSFSVLSVVHIANVFAHEISETPYQTVAPTLDREYIDQLGLTKEIPIWKKQFEKAYGEAS